MTQDKARKLAPEWAVERRGDAVVAPEVGGGWSLGSAPLARGASFTDFRDHHIAAPMGDTPAEAAVRTHEMIHASLSPAFVPNELMAQMGLSHRSVALAEEVRVNYVGAVIASRYDPKTDHVGGDTRKLTDGTEKSLCDTICETRNWNDALNIYLNTINTDVHKAVKRRLRRVEEWREPLERVTNQLIRDGVVVASWSRHFAHAANTDPVIYRWRGRKGDEREAMLNAGFAYFTLPLAQQIEAWLDNPPGSASRAAGLGGKPQRIEQSGEWQQLKIGMTNLTETTASFIGRRKRPAITGKYPTRPDRLLTDPERRIFRETVRSNGGVVVFDCSGSMGVSHDTVRDAVRQFAGATVLVYSDSTRGHSANAWVVARNGRMISRDEFDELPLHAGNGVDGPALRWALRQRRSPKDFILWVSDGHVTGKHDRTSSELLNEVAHLSKRHNIIGVDTCEQAVQLLADMKRTGSVPRNRYCSVVTAEIERNLL